MRENVFVAGFPAKFSQLLYMFRFLMFFFSGEENKLYSNKISIEYKVQEILTQPSIQNHTKYQVERALTERLGN